jgi:hypothetical protein
MRLIALVRHNVPGVRILIALLSLTCPCVCQMVYNVSVYTDAQVGNDGNTLFATSTTVDSSTGCSAHGSYSTTATLIGPTGAQAPATASGMVANTSMDINGLEGDYTAFGTVQFYCGCFGHWVGGGGWNIPISVGEAVGYYTDGVPTLLGCDYGSLACLGNSLPSCVGAATFTSQVGCSLYYRAVLLKVTFFYVYPECFPLGWGQSWPGPGLCQ